jgi:hypothetical protein
VATLACCHFLETRIVDLYREYGDSPFACLLTLRFAFTEVVRYSVNGASLEVDRATGYITVPSSTAALGVRPATRGARLGADCNRKEPHRDGVGTAFPGQRPRFSLAMSC